MPKYRVYGAIAASKYLGEFEAATEEQAIELAMAENGHVSMCHQCSSECEDPEINDATAELIEEQPKVTTKRTRKESRNGK